MPTLGFALMLAAGCGGEPKPGGPDGGVDFTLTSVPGVWIAAEGSGETSSVTFLEIREPADAGGGNVDLPFHSGRVDYAGNSAIVIGRFVLDPELGTGGTEVDRRHIFDEANELVWVQREGARTEDHDPPESTDVSLRTPDDRLVIESGEIAGEYRRLETIFEDLEQGAGLESQEGAEQAVALLGALARLSKSRIDYWGGPNIGSYAGFEKSVDGLSATIAKGLLELQVTGTLVEPNSFFFYDALTDFFGMSIDGSEDVLHDLTGSGSFDADLQISYQPFGAHPGATIDLTVVDGEIIAGAVSGGSVTVFTGSAEFSVDATLLQNVTTEAILGN